MLRIPDFVKSELLYIKENANLTEREETLLNLRNKEIPLEQCAERMNCSVSTVYRVSRSMKRKIFKILDDDR